MATVTGTSGNDFIHVSDDGLTAPAGTVNNAGATNGDDTISSGSGGSDFITAGAGNDTIKFGADLDSSDIINGANGNDTLVIGGETDVTFGANELTSIEKITLSAIPLQHGTAGFQNLVMNDGNVAAGQTMTINAALLSADTFFAFDGSAETDGKFSIFGGLGDDTIFGGQGGGFFDLTQGGDDFVRGGAGVDSLFFDDKLTAADNVVLGQGDALSIGGSAYAAGLTFTASTLVTTNASLQLNTNSSYKLIMNDANVTAGSHLVVQASGFLTSDQTVFFDGSAEKDGSFTLQGFNGNDTLIGSRGDDFFLAHDGNDTLTLGAGNDFVDAGAGNDKIIAGGQLALHDFINGGADIDTLSISGNYAAGLVFTENTLVNFEKINLGHGTFNLTSDDATVAAGAALTVNGTVLTASESVAFNGAAETDGRFILEGGAGADTLVGGASADRLLGGHGADDLSGGGGVDRFLYAAAADSSSLDDHDIVRRADFKADKWDVPIAITAIDSAIVHGKLTDPQFDVLLAKAVDAAHLGVHHAVLFTPDAGGFAGTPFLVVELNGVAGYQGGADLVVQLVNAKNLDGLDIHDFV